jgi:hypothetical protein
MGKKGKWGTGETGWTILAETTPRRSIGWDEGTVLLWSAVAWHRFGPWRHIWSAGGLAPLWPMAAYLECRWPGTALARGGSSPPFVKEASSERLLRHVAAIKATVLVKVKSRNARVPGESGLLYLYPFTPFPFFPLALHSANLRIVHLVHSSVISPPVCQKSTRSVSLNIPSRQ